MYDAGTGTTTDLGSLPGYHSSIASAINNRGHVVGTVVSGILIGILVSRTISGLVADAAGWRAIYVVAAITAVNAVGDVIGRLETADAELALRRAEADRDQVLAAMQGHVLGAGELVGTYRQTVAPLK